MRRAMASARDKDRFVRRGAGRPSCLFSRPEGQVWRMRAAIGKLDDAYPFDSFGVFDRRREMRDCA